MHKHDYQAIIFLLFPIALDIIRLIVTTLYSLIYGIDLLFFSNFLSLFNYFLPALRIMRHILWLKDNEGIKISRYLIIFSIVNNIIRIFSLGLIDPFYIELISCLVGLTQDLHFSSECEKEDGKSK